MQRAHAADGGGEAVLEALLEQPGGRELLALGSLGSEIALVGGAVRDLLRGQKPRELDVVVVAADVGDLAGELARLLGGSSVLHERFGTASVVWEGGRIDIAARRAESYPSPGALPEVRPGTVAEDLARRDFTVNAIAVSLEGPRRGALLGAEHALADLAAGQLRVLHGRSFVEDPTRLLRLARYRARLRFEIDPETAALAADALAAGALMTVSRARLGAELRLALGEGTAPAALASMDELGVLADLPAALRFDRELAERALALLPDDGRRDVLLMAVLLLHMTLSAEADPEAVIFTILDDLEFTAADRERILRSVLAAPALVGELTLSCRSSQLQQLLCVHTSEAIALAAALADPSGDAAAAAREWFERVRLVALEINGEDLLAAGVPAGPEIGLMLRDALARKLDGELAGGREDELGAALRARR